MVKEFSRRLAEDPPKLDAEQLALVAVTKSMAAEYAASLIKAKKLSWPVDKHLVLMTCKYIISDGGSNRATGQVVTIVDGPAGIVAGSIADYCSSVRVQHSDERGNPARITASARSIHDRTYATVKLFPTPLQNREFVIRCIATQDDDGTIMESFTPVDDTVDYGFSTRKLVRGKTFGHYTIKPIACGAGSGIEQCSVTLTQKFDAGGFIPLSIVNSLVPFNLSMLCDLRQQFQKDEQVDAEEHSSLIRFMLNEGGAPVSELEEAQRLRTATLLLLHAGNSAKDAVPGTDPLLKTEELRPKTDEISVFRTELTVDGTPVQVAASFLSVESRANKKAFYEEDGGETLEVEKSVTSPQNQLVTSVVNPEGVGTRASFGFKTNVAWARTGTEGEENNHYTVVGEPEDWKVVREEPPQRLSALFLAKGNDHEAGDRRGRFMFMVQPKEGSIVGIQKSKFAVKLPLRKANVVRKAQHHFHLVLKPVAEELVVANIPQTTVVFHSRVKVGNALRAVDINRFSLGAHVRIASRLRVHFDRSAAVDAAKRGDFVAMIEGDKAGAYSEGDRAHLSEGIQFVEEFNLKAPKDLSSGSPLVSFEVVDDVNSLAGRAVFIIRSPAKEALAFCWNDMARNQAKIDTVENTKLVEPNPHHVVKYVKKRMKFMKERDFVAKAVWELRVGGSIEEGESFLLVSLPAEHPERPITAAAVRARMWSTVRLRPITSTETEIDYTMRIAYGQKVPKLVGRNMTKHQLRRITAMQQYFQQFRTLVVLDMKDGEAMGEAMMVSRGKQGKKSTKGIFQAHDALVALGKECPFLEEFFVGVVDIDTMTRDNPFGKNQFNQMTRLRAVDRSDGGRLARVLKKYLQSSANEGIAVKRFLFEVRSMEEFAEKHPSFFQPMLERMCLRLVALVTIGVQFQCCKMVFASWLDVGTDLWTAFVYSDAGDDDTSNSLVTIVVTSLLCQVLFAVVVHHKNWKVMLREVFYTVTYIRSGILHFRVLTRQVQDKHAFVDALTEYMVGAVLSSAGTVFPQSFALI